MSGPKKGWTIASWLTDTSRMLHSLDKLKKTSGTANQLHFSCCFLRQLLEVGQSRSYRNPVG
jgi:hypothetical protein